MKRRKPAWVPLTGEARNEFLGANRGIIARISEQCNVSPTTVARHLAGEVKRRRNPRVVEALRAAMEAGK